VANAYRHSYANRYPYHYALVVSNRHTIAHSLADSNKNTKSNFHENGTNPNRHRHSDGYQHGSYADPNTFADTKTNLYPNRYPDPLAHPNPIAYPNTVIDLYTLVVSNRHTIAHPLADSN
jgi:hypothetical protein